MQILKAQAVVSTSSFARPSVSRQDPSRALAPFFARPQRPANPKLHGLTVPCASADPKPMFHRVPTQHMPVPIDPGTGREVPWYGPIPKYYQAPRPDFPLVLEPTAGAPASLSELGLWARKAVDANLTTCKAILMRGLPIATAEDFTSFMEAVGYKPMPFEGILMRRPTDGGKHTYNVATEPPESVLVPHNEAMAEPQSNSKIIFACLQNATGGGGESLLVPTSDLTDAVGKDLIQQFKDRGGIRYMRWYPSASQQDAIRATGATYVPPAWYEWTMTQEPAAAVQYFKDRGWKDIRWDAEGGLRLNIVSPATREMDGRELWLNIANLVGYGEGFTVSYGNGMPIEKEVREHLSTLRWHHAVVYSMQPGDVMFVDNYRALHGRTPYEGHRKLLSWMTLN